MSWPDHIETVTLPLLKTQNRLMRPAPFEPREHSHYWTHEEARAHLEARRGRVSLDSRGLALAEVLVEINPTSWVSLVEHFDGQLGPDEVWDAATELDGFAPDQLPFWIIPPRFGPMARVWTMDARLSDMARAVGAVLLETSEERVDSLELLDWLSATTAADVLGALAELRSLYPGAITMRPMTPRWEEDGRVYYPERMWALANRATGEACGQGDVRFARLFSRVTRPDGWLGPLARLVYFMTGSEAWPPRDANELASWLGVDPGTALEALWETSKADLDGPMPEWAYASDADGWNARMSRAVVSSAETTKLGLAVSTHLLMDGPWPACTRALDIAARSHLTEAEVLEGARELRRAGFHHIHPWPAGLDEQTR